MTNYIAIAFQYCAGRRWYPCGLHYNASSWIALQKKKKIDSVSSLSIILCIICTKWIILWACDMWLVLHAVQSTAEYYVQNTRAQVCMWCDNVIAGWRFICNKQYNVCIDRQYLVIVPEHSDMLLCVSMYYTI